MLLEETVILVHYLPSLLYGAHTNASSRQVHAITATNLYGSRIDLFLRLLCQQQGGERVVRFMRTLGVDERLDST
jgi:hypothetical protein